MAGLHIHLSSREAPPPLSPQPPVSDYFIINRNRTKQANPPHHYCSGLCGCSLQQQLDCCYYQVMKTLTSSCSNIILDKKGDNRPVFSSRELRHEVSILPSKKLLHSVGFLHWLCVKHKPICPIRGSSSFSPESQACNLFFNFSLALCISQYSSFRFPNSPEILMNH